MSTTFHTEATLDTTRDSTNVTVSETLPKETGNPENKQEPSQIGIENSVEFINPDSKLHKRLLEELAKNIPEQAFQKARRGEFAANLDGRTFSTYSGDRGIEFYEHKVKWHEQFEGVDDSFKKMQELQAEELERLGDWNAHNESIIYQLVADYNHVSFEEYGLPNVIPVNVDCRGHICSVHFSHPHNGEKVYAGD